MTSCWYRQKCLIVLRDKENNILKERIAWIPEEKYSKINKTIRIKEEEGWQVIEVYGRERKKKY